MRDLGMQGAWVWGCRRRGQRGQRQIWERVEGTRDLGVQGRGRWNGEVALGDERMEAMDLD